MISTQQQQQQASFAPASHPINPPSAATTAVRSPTATPTQTQLPTPLSLAPLSSSSAAARSADHAVGPPPPPIAVAHPNGEPVPSPLPRVRLSDISPFYGAPSGPYLRAVDALSGSLMRHNAAVIELGSDAAAVMRCGLEAARFYFRSGAAQQGGAGGKGGRGVYMYRAGRY